MPAPLSPTGTALIVFAKAPVPGQVKTRLIPALGAVGAAALARRLLDHTLWQAGALAVDHRELCVAPDADDPTIDSALAQARGHWQRHPQGDGDLGERMHRALGRVLATHGKALLIGTDVPAWSAARLHEAMQALDTHDAVFVPALDGGYALVGLTRPAPALFQQMHWSTAQVMAQTRVRARSAGLRWCEFTPVADIDEPADLVHLPPGWR